MSNIWLRTATLAAVLAAAAGCGSTATAPDDLPAQGATVEAFPSADPGDAHEDGAGTAPSAPPVNAAMLAAHTYVRMWARPALNRDAWYAGVRPLVVSAYAQLLADTDPARVPARVVTGSPQPVSSTTAVLVADVPTDAGAVRVTVVNTAGRWLIASASPATTP